jgi:two-component system nitrate/nitrite sensor histidine kinase NarX
MQTRTEIGVSRFLQQMADSKQPLIVPDMSKTSSAWVANYSWPYLSYLGVPIHLRGEIIGFINLNIKPANFFTPIHADRLKAFSEQANIAIQNARLFAQSRELAVLEERQRLARDLHDAVSQTLFSATVISEALPRIWKNSPDRVETLLHELHELTRGALAETRALLMELRPASLLAIEFQALLQQLVEAMQSRRNIKISLMVDQLPELPADVKIAFYRITQEALNNIVKHASATEANIMLQRRRKSIRLSIFDNGVGFDKDDVEPISFGLSIMNERAESIDARFKNYSEVGQGTQILVIWVNDLMDTGSLE